MARQVQVFFYGSFINVDVLAEVDLRPQKVEVARLDGFDIHIGPLANIVPSNERSVYGIVCGATHAELERLYGQGWVSEYLPEAVVVETQDGHTQPALTYIAPDPPVEPAANDYIDRIVNPARELGFPDAYIARLESFRP